ncbi:MAG: PAS domain S-box protein, partial [Burkholderiales bacterium]|nr:PAS domain S-box protein [Burkholderiales bacterium]
AVDLVPMAQFFANGAAIAFAIHYYQRWVVSHDHALRSTMRDLAHTRDQLRRTFDETPVGISHTTLDGHWLRCNPTLLKMLGCDEQDLVGRHFRDILHPDELPDVMDRRARLLDGRVEGYQAEKRYRRKDGSWFWVAVTLSLARNADGTPSYMISTVEDIDGRREAQQKLRLSDARFQSFMDAVPAMAWLSDADGRHVYLNQAWEREVGRPRNLWLGRSAGELQQSGAAAPDPHAGAAVLHSGRPSDVVEDFGGADGAPRRWRVVRFPVQAPDGGQLLGGMAIEITREVRAQAALRDSEARMLAIIRSASDGIVSTDGEGRVSLFNPAAERMFGLGAASMLGQPLDRLLPAEARTRHPTLMAGFAGSGVSQRQMGTGRVTAVHADGRRMELEASISQVKVDGDVILTAMLRDITERTRAERRLVAYQLELAGLNRRLLAQEKETTRRLAQSLHDELGQTLAALRMQFDVLRQRGYVAAAAATAADEGNPAAGLQRIDLLISQANRQVREALTELRPPLLDELGLAVALENELSRQSESGIGPRMSLVVDPVLRDHRWPGDVEFAVFMVAREAIYNAIRHAGATMIEVVLEGDLHSLDVWIDDNGIGLPDEPLRARPGHLGLVGMRERAGSIGARLEMGSTDGQGTRVHLAWQSAAEYAPVER